jgi:hypothetical protein
MMKDLRDKERMISAALDGELGGEELLPLLDGLSSSESARRYYRRARRLQELLEPRERANRPHRSAGRAVHPGGRRAETRPGSRPWAALTAIFALLLIGVAAWKADSLFPIGGPTELQPVAIELRLGENAGHMSEREFAQMTVELLRADPRYQRKMLDVLRQIHPDPAIGLEDPGQERLLARWVPERGESDEEHQDLEVAADLY